MERAQATVGAALALLLCACAAAAPPAGTGPPRAALQGAYPVILAASEERRERSLAAWKAMLGGQAATAAAAPPPELWPVTATLRALPEGMSATLRLPLVRFEDGEERAEEATRESLRRFIDAATPLVTDGPGELSLLGVEGAAGGTRRALYQQKPFDLPLRGGYGVVEVAFTPDLRVVGLSSTAIPDNNNRLQRALTNVRQQLTVEQAAAALADRPVNFVDASGAERTRVTRADLISARELVVYPVTRGATPAVLELHLAWEMEVGGGGAGEPLLVYVDAVTGEQVAAAPAPAAGGAAAADSPPIRRKSDISP